MRCDPGVFTSMSKELPVSIPAGFSDALRHDHRGNAPANVRVSIPAGFSDALRRSPRRQYNTSIEVSIPAGFSDALRHT